MASTAPAPSSAPPASSTSDANSGGGSGKSMFDQTPEEAAAHKEQLRKFSSGDPAVSAGFHSKPLDPALAARVEKDDSKDPFYNNKSAAKEDYYTAATNPADKEDEAITVKAASMLMADPTDLSRVIKETTKESK